MTASNAVLDKLLGIKPKGEIPVILVRRELPHVLTHQLHENGWVGLRKVIRGGVPSFEKNYNFTLVINLDGMAEIPDCEENRARLDKLCQPRKRLQPVMVKSPGGGMVKKKVGGKSVMEEVEIAPLYERMDVAVLSDNLLDALADRMEQRAAAREAEDFEVGEDEDVAPAAPRAARVAKPKAEVKPKKVTSKAKTAE